MTKHLKQIKSILILFFSLISVLILPQVVKATFSAGWVKDNGITENSSLDSGQWEIHLDFKNQNGVAISPQDMYVIVNSYKDINVDGDFFDLGEKIELFNQYYANLGSTQLNTIVNGTGHTTDGQIRIEVTILDPSYYVYNSSQPSQQGGGWINKKIWSKTLYLVADGAEVNLVQESPAWVDGNPDLYYLNTSNQDLVLDINKSPNSTGITEIFINVKNLETDELSEFPVIFSTPKASGKVYVDASSLPDGRYLWYTSLMLDDLGQYYNISSPDNFIKDTNPPSVYSYYDEMHNIPETDPIYKLSYTARASDLYSGLESLIITLDRLNHVYFSSKDCGGVERNTDDQIYCDIEYDQAEVGQDYSGTYTATDFAGNSTTGNLPYTTVGLGDKAAVRIIARTGTGFGEYYDYNDHETNINYFVENVNFTSPCLAWGCLDISGTTALRSTHINPYIYYDKYSTENISTYLEAPTPITTNFGQKEFSCWDGQTEANVYGLIEENVSESNWEYPYHANYEYVELIINHTIDNIISGSSLDSSITDDMIANIICRKWQYDTRPNAFFSGSISGKDKEGINQTITFDRGIDCDITPASMPLDSKLEFVEFSSKSLCSVSANTCSKILTKEEFCSDQWCWPSWGCNRVTLLYYIKRKVTVKGYVSGFEQTGANGVSIQKIAGVVGSSGEENTEFDFEFSEKISDCYFTLRAPGSHEGQIFNRWVGCTYTENSGRDCVVTSTDIENKEELEFHVDVHYATYIDPIDTPTELGRIKVFSEDGTRVLPYYDINDTKLNHPALRIYADDTERALDLLPIGHEQASKVRIWHNGVQWAIRGYIE